MCAIDDALSGHCTLPRLHLRRISGARRRARPLFIVEERQPLAQKIRGKPILQCAGVSALDRHAVRDHLTVVKEYLTEEWRTTP